MSTTYPDPRMVDASTVLDNLWDIIEREQLDHVGYVGQEVDDMLRESGAICRGHRACAVGACWLAGGIEPRTHVLFGGGREWILPGVFLDDIDRRNWLDDEGYHGVCAAYEALNKAAQEYMDERGLESSSTWSGCGSLEELFETQTEECGYLIEPRDMLVVVDRAKEIVVG